MNMSSDIFQHILDFLNFPERASFDEIRCFLIKKGLCQFEFMTGTDGHNIYSLFSKREVQERRRRDLPVSIALAEAAEPIDDTKVYTLLFDPAYYQERVIFPEFGPDSDDGAAVKKAFYSVIDWFKVFMLGCSAGVMDVTTLNRFKSTQKLILEFRQTKNSMNPILSPVGMTEHESDATLECKILSLWIYPFIFTVSGDNLSRIRRCRQCGSFFKGIRLHASFCTTKCRMTWNYRKNS